MKDVDKIKSLIEKLPKSDIIIGNSLINKRDFAELQLLVDSAIIKIKSNLSSDCPKDEYKSIDLESLENLSILIVLYREQLIENLPISREEDFLEEDIPSVTDSFFEELY